MDTSTDGAIAGDQVRRQRLRAGLTQRELANRAGLSVRTVRYIEQGRIGRPHASSIRQLSTVLGLPETGPRAPFGGARPAPGPRPPHVAVLGVLVVRQGDATVEVTSARRRDLLGLLAVQPGQPVPVADIVDVLWGERPARTCTELVHTYVGQLRQLLDAGRPCGDEPGVVRRIGGAYQLDLGPDRLDLAAFDELADRAHQARAAGAARLAADLYSRAWAWSRGPVLSGAGTRLRHHPAVVAAGRRRIAMLLEFAEVALALGHGERVIGPLEKLITEEPLHERLVARLVLALGACGRRAAAVELYHRTRDLLDTQLGVPPGDELSQAYDEVTTGRGAATPAARGSTAGTGDAIVRGHGRPASTAVALAPVPAQLPAAPAHFVGRAECLSQLDELLYGHDEGRAATVMITAISGSGGVGKTALALHWAHRVRDRFPDGQLYVDLRGHATSPSMRPMEALGGFLYALGMPPEALPDDVSQAAAAYRSLLAGKRMLVLLDNAATADQIRPLLPASPGTVVLVTGRHRMPSLAARDGARSLPLDVLEPVEATALLERILGAQRVRAECAAAELARLCGYLPLALRIVAANLAARSGRAIADLVVSLSAGNRLDALTTDDDKDTAVRATFALSYTAIPAATQRMFRLFGLVPGMDVTAETAAALAEVPPDQAARLLDDLATRHLAEEHTRGRYRMHDLLHLYASELSAATGDLDGSRAATGRLARHYLHAVRATARLLYPHLLYLPGPPPSGGEPAGLHTPDQASRWLDAERRNLITLAERLPAEGHPRLTWLLADSLQGYFRSGAHAVDWETVNDAALRAASAAADPRAQAAAHLSEGSRNDFRGDCQQASVHYEKVVTLAERAGWLDAQAVAVNNLARSHWHAGRWQATVDCLTRALDLHERSGRAAGRAVTLANLGLAFWRVGQLPGGPASVGLAREDDCLRRAIEHLSAAASVHHDIGDRVNQADTLAMLAVCHRDAGDIDTAHDLATSAVELARQLTNRIVDARTLNALAAVHARRHRYRAAVAGHEQALAIARDLENPQLEADVLIDLAETHAWQRRPRPARLAAQEALRLAAHIDSRLLAQRVRAVLAHLDAAP